MTVPVNSYAGAVAAYARAAGGAGAPAPEEGEAPAETFAALLKTAVTGAIETANRGERMSLAAINDRADITEVVTAVAEAELTLQTVVAVRDRVIGAYQDVMRMAI